MIKRIFIISIVILSSLLSFFLLKNYLSQFVNSSKHVVNKDENNGKKTSSPELFAEYHRGIRTRNNENRSGYQLNHRFVEIKKSRNRIIKTGHKEKQNDGITFIERGPANVPGRTRGLLVLSTDPSNNTWLAGSSGGGIWKTSDGGNLWVNKSADFPSLSVTTLASSEKEPAIIYAGTGEYVASLGTQIGGDGIFKSEDGGETWIQLSSTAGNPIFQSVTRIVVDPNNEDIALASISPNYWRGSFSGVVKTFDGGISWQEVFQSTQPVEQIIVDPGNFNKQYAAINGVGTAISLDAGNTWHIVELEITGRIELAVSPVNPERLYASAEGNISGTGSDFYVSDDGGNNWDFVPVVFEGRPVNFLGFQGRYDNTILAHPFDENFVYLGGRSLFRVIVNKPDNSSSAFQADILPIADVYGLFNRRNLFITFGVDLHPDQHFMLPIITNPITKKFRILLSNDGGVFISNDGVTPGTEEGDWFMRGRTYNTTQFYGVDKMPGGNRYLGGAQDNGTWFSPENNEADASTNYKFALRGDGFEVLWHSVDTNKMIGGSQFNNISRTTDGGKSWENSNPSSPNTRNPFITKLAGSKSTPDVIYSVSFDGVYKSINFGEKWKLVPVKENWVDGSPYFLNVEVSRANANIVWAGAGMSDLEKIHVSTDAGESFLPTNNFPGTSYGFISGLATHPTQDSTGYSLFSFANGPKVLRSKNLGQSWEDISGYGEDSTSSNGFPDVAIYCLYVHPDNTDIIWVGSEIGIIESRDNGKSWNIREDFINVSVWDMKGQDNEIVLATHGRGIWSAITPNSQNGVRPAIIEPLSLNFSNEVDIKYEFKHSFDSCKVYINKKFYTSIKNLTPGKGSLKITDLAGMDSIMVSFRSFIKTSPYESSSNNLEIIPYNEPIKIYETGFDDRQDDFTLDGMFFSEGDFSSLESSHNYPDESVLSARFNSPIIVDGSLPELSYKDIAIVEPNNDYVILEATKDGLNWLPLTERYDAKLNDSWRMVFSNNSKPAIPAMFVRHTINLLDTFNPNDTIAIRFKLVSNNNSNGFGWLIDDLFIQSRPLNVSDYLSGFNFNVYPNPSSNGQLSIDLSNELNRSKYFEITLIDLLGKKLITKITQGEELKGQLLLQTTDIPNGIYQLRVYNGEVYDTRKIIIKN